MQMSDHGGEALIQKNHNVVYPPSHRLFLHMTTESLSVLNYIVDNIVILVIVLGTNYEYYKIPHNTSNTLFLIVVALKDHMFDRYL